jgi:hypothetical protein
MSGDLADRRVAQSALIRLHRVAAVGTFMAFSSEVDTGLREENASKQKANLTGKTVGDGSPHHIKPIQHSAVVVVFVPEKQDGQSDQRRYKTSHLVFPSLLAQQRRRPARRLRFLSRVFFIRRRLSRSFDRIEFLRNVARFRSSILARSPIGSGSAFSS